MARTVVGYIGANGMNNMASASPTGSIEAATGLPIATGLVVGEFRELGAGLAASYSYQSAGTYPWGQLYDGTYMWVQLDPTVTTDPIPLGTSVSWLQSAETTGQATQVTTLGSTNTDFAGITIDSNFGKTHPYAFIQLNGKVSALFDNTGHSLAHIGDVVYLSTGTYGSLATAGSQTTALTGESVGLGLVASGTDSVRNLVRINRAVARF